MSTRAEIMAGVLANRRAEFFKSIDVHCLKPHQGYALQVMLLYSDNEYISYPKAGVLHIVEQGVDLHISQAVFHAREDDGHLGPPVTARNAIFTYLPRAVV